MSQHWFAAERPSPSARERVLSVSIRVHLWPILPPSSSLVIFIPSQRHGSGGGDSSGWTGSMLGGDPGPMRSRSGIEPAFIPRSWRGFVQPRMGRQFIAWRR